MSRATRTPTTDDAAAAESLAEPPEERTASVRRWGYSLPGLVGALVFVCLSLSPSLLPRTGLIQGLVCGITGAVGYGIGVLAAWMWRAFADREARPARRRSWQILAVPAAACLIPAHRPRGWSSARVRVHQPPRPRGGRPGLRPGGRGAGRRRPRRDVTAEGGGDGCAVSPGEGDSGARARR
jgi:uncharacterized membrane protein